MRHWILSACVALLAIGTRAEPLRVIFDTDMDSDVDDVAALCQLHAMADTGEVALLGVMLSGLNQDAPGCAGAINTFYGRPAIPLGQATGPRAILQSSAYAGRIAREFANHGPAPRPAVALYRELLAAAPDHSVVVISVGDLTNLAGLLGSPDGRALIEAKVIRYVCMGSRYPADTDPGTNRWGNFRTDPVSAREVVEGWPTPILFVGGGRFAESMAIGRRITALDPTAWPVSRAYQLYFAQQKNGPVRHTADSLTVLAAVRGCAPWFKVVDQGHNDIDAVGRNAWRPEPDAANQAYTSELVHPEDAPRIADLLESLATQPPRLAASRRP